VARGALRERAKNRKRHRYHCVVFVLRWSCRFSFGVGFGFVSCGLASAQDAVALTSLDVHDGEQPTSLGRADGEQPPAAGTVIEHDQARVIESVGGFVERHAMLASFDAALSESHS